MFEESLVHIVGQLALWCMGSFSNWLKSQRLNPIIKGSRGVIEMVPMTILLDGTTRVVLEPVVGGFFPLSLAPDMRTTSGREYSQSHDESDRPK